MLIDEPVASSPAFLMCLERARAVAQTDATVLILGESGVGKELIARYVHAKSGRSDNTLVTVNCAAIPRDLFESEFFGHVKGAFSSAHRDRQGKFELATGGTLFLDEVGEIPPELQSKLLRALQQMTIERVGDDVTRHVDVRVIAATNRPLANEVNAGRFRRDLYYRLSTFPIEVPPLRDRPEDIVPLAASLIADIAVKLGKQPPRLDAALIDLLRAHDWPGNVRELRNVLERALILNGDLSHLEVGTGNLTPGKRKIEATTERKEVPTQRGYLTASELTAFERDNLVAALETARWRVSGTGGAASLLGQNASTVASRMKALDIVRPASTSLYIRLGGQFRIAAFARDLLGRLQADPQTARFWSARSTIGIHREEKLLIEYLCSVAGGPRRYSGRDLKQAHAHLSISPSDWKILLNHLHCSFSAMGLDDACCDDISNHVAQIRDSIVADTSYEPLAQSG